MYHNVKTTGKAMSMTGGLVAGALVSVLITIIGVLVLSKLLAGESMGWEDIGYGIAGMLLTASFSGAVTAMRSIKRRVFLVCMGSGGIYFGILLMITALFFGGNYEAVGVTACVIACGSTCAALLNVRRKRRRTIANHRKYC